jgi:peptide/nickel transport system substrate-binding protein
MAVVGVFAIVAAACGDDGEPPEDTDTGTTEPTETGSETPTEEPLPVGGTLNLSMVSDVAGPSVFDPQVEYYSVTWEYYRCCLLRTLMSYTGDPADQGGTEIFPDLAAEEPTVSADGLTWTFKIREGVTYAPPFQDVEITAADFVRAIEREANPDVGAQYPFYYSVIEGFDDSDGTPGSVSGMVAVDDKTLEVHLTQPTGDLGYRFAMAATAPIPEGADVGHEKDYGRFLVASGPYMFEGSEALDFSLPPKDQTPVAGYEPGKFFTFVRNPSWDRATDPLRGENAFVDRIEVVIGTTEEDAAAKIDAGELDMMVDGVTPADQVKNYRETPDLQDQFFVNPSDAVRYLSMNVAQPPFDDVHVRKAVSFAIDKDGMRRLRPGGELSGEIAGHIMVPGVLGSLLADYDPYASANSQGDIDAAKAEMAQSKYDTDGDGVCDAPECSGVLSVTDEADPYPDQAALIQDNLAPLGLELDVKQFDRGTMYDKCNDPAAHVAFCLAPGWGKDYPNASTFAEPLFSSIALGPDSCCNYAVLGASPDQLAEWGYAATEVPSVDDKVAECAPLQGDDQSNCWAELDQMLMEEVVPWVPYLFDNYVRVVSARVLNYTFDQFAGLPALEKLALADAA